MESNISQQLTTVVRDEGDSGDRGAVDQKDIDQNGWGNWPQELALDPESQQRVDLKWEQIRCYGFQIGGLNLLAPLDIYCELLTKPRIESMPNAPEHFLGLTNVRGNLVPVYQLEPLLNKKSAAPNYAFIIGKLDQAGALLIPAKPKQFDLHGFTRSDSPTPGHDFLQAAITEQYEHGDEEWYMINHKLLFQSLANPGTTIPL